MQFGVFEILGIIAAGQLLLLTLFLITHKKGNQLSNRLLAAFLFTVALIVIDFLHMRFQLHLSFPHLLLFGFSFVFLQGPLLYFYTQSVTSRDLAMRKVHMIHLLPFLIFWAYMVIFYHCRPLEVKLDLIALDEPEFMAGLGILYLFIHVQIIAYMVAALRSLHGVRRRQKDLIKRLSLRWLNIGLILFLILWVIDLVIQIIGQIGELPLMLYYGFSFFCMSLYFIFANLAVFKSLQQPDLILGETSKIDRTKYIDSKLTSSQSEKILKMLQEYMNAHKPFLDPSIQINEIAKALHIPSRHLSQVINDKLKQHFFDFVNSYRIEEARRIITGVSAQRKTMLEICYEVGFNSKSAFNNAFKKHTGMTPTEFKRMRNTATDKP